MGLSLTQIILFVVWTMTVYALGIYIGIRLSK